MGRKRRPFKRPEGKRDASLIIIATEGRKTERLYFELLALEYESTKIHIEVLAKLDNNSSPEHVISQLDEFANEYELDSNDELWMLIDRDYQSWTAQMIKLVAQKCHQKKGYYLGLSNPSFEIWLILHLVQIDTFSKEEKNKLFKNAKVARGKTYTKKFLSDILGSFNPSKYDPEPFVKNVEKAIQRAKSIDKHPKTRWPDYLGTRVYKLAERIID